jgi:hypothetical protein
VSRPEVEIVDLPLLGASAFVAEHPWERDVRLSLNFDVRGNSGQVQTLLETFSGNVRYP